MFVLFQKSFLPDPLLLVLFISYTRYVEERQQNVNNIYTFEETGMATTIAGDLKHPFIIKR